MFDNLNFDTNKLLLLLAVTAIFLLVLVAVLFIWVTRLSQKYNRFMMGKDAKSLEASLGTSLAKLDKILVSDMQRTKRVEEVAGKLKSSYQKVGIVKYDAFKEMGGKLSFALALLNANDDGFVLNVMHSREACYTYIKEIIKGESYITLGDEEKEALEKAINQE